MPQHLALAGGALIVAGSESYHLPAGALVFERRDPATGQVRWQQRIAPAGRPCATAECHRMKASLNGIGVRRGGVLYAAQRGAEAPAGLFGELALDTGAERRPILRRAQRRGLAIGADDTGLYFLEDAHDERYSLVKTDPTAAEVAWRHEIPTALRLHAGAPGLVLWFGGIAARSPATGQLLWTSPLAGTFTDVAVDATAIHVTSMLDAGGSPYFALAKLDPATGRVVWLRRSAEYRDSAPPGKIAVTAEHIYLHGYEGDRWFVERRRRSDGALGNVTTQVRSLGAALAR